MEKTGKGKMEGDRYNEAWVANRLAKRKRTTGTRFAVDPNTGYLDPLAKHGFSARRKKKAIERLRVCSNMAQIAKSVKVSIVGFYDAIATDPLFRKHVNEACLIEGRSKKLYRNMERNPQSDSTTGALVNDLMAKMSKYD